MGDNATSSNLRPARPPYLARPQRVAAIVITAAALFGACEASPVVPAGPPIFQDGNHRPTSTIVPLRFRQLAGNRLGDVFPLDPHDAPCPPAATDWAFTHVGDLSLKWVRLSVDRMEWQQAKDLHQFSLPDINPCQDEIVTLLAANDIIIMHTIVHWDATLHADRYPDYRQEAEIQPFLDHARLIVHQFKGRVRYYEVLNEAVAYVELPDYLNLIRRVVPIIREEDPDAKIVVGGSTDLRLQYAHDYLFGVLQSDVMPLVDGIAIHPMYGPSPQYDAVRQYYYDYPSLVQEIKNVAGAHGFTGEFFAEEMDWRTARNPNPYEPWQYTEIQAAKYYGRGIVMNLGMGLWTGIGGEMYDVIQPIPTVVRNLGTILGGATPQSRPVEIRAGGAVSYMTFGFTLPDGEQLVAVWTNDAALDEDAGVRTTLAFAGLSGWRAVGIDPLKGLEQPLTVASESDVLVVRDLLVRDYPLFLRLGR